MNVVRRLALVVTLVVVGACAPDPDLPLPGAITRAAAAYVSQPTSERARAVVDAIDRTSDARGVPHLIDLVRIGVSSSVTERALPVLSRLTGLPPGLAAPELYQRAGTWLADHPQNPGPGYVDFKATVYRSVDPRFDPALRQVTDPTLVAGLQWGGVPYAGIPELNDPQRSGLDALGWADRAEPDELILGADIGGRAIGYPVRILGRHELANDTVDGRPVALAYCTLCRTALLFDRRVDGRTLTFQTSGLLLESNKVMVDRETGSLWRQLTGEAFAGPLTGRQLELLSVETTTWAQWWAAHPDGWMLELPAPFKALSEIGEITTSYTYTPQSVQPQYYASDKLWFPAATAGPAFPPKTEVATVVVDGAALAVDVAALRAAGPTVIALGADASVIAVPTAVSAQFHDARAADLQPGDPVPAELVGRLTQPPSGQPALPKLASGQTFWFAWYGLHPETTWWPA